MPAILIVLIALFLAADAKPADAPDALAREWIVLGPFGNRPTDGPGGASRSAYDQPLVELKGDEGALQLVAGESYRVAGGGATLQARAVSARPDGAVDLAKLFSDAPLQAAYLFAWIDSERAGRRPLLFGSDDSAKVWINGELVHATWQPGGRGLRPRAEVFEAEFRAGRNAVLVKVEQFSGGWGAVLEAPRREDAAPLLAERLRLEPRARLRGDRAEIEAGLNFDPTLFPELAQSLRVEDVAGRTVAERALDSGERFALDLAPGAYRVAARAAKRADLAGETAFVVGRSAREYAQAQAKAARALLEKDPDSPAAGWVAYQSATLDAALASAGADDGALVLPALQIERWSGAGAPAMLARTGVFEWAYRSKLDGSGQPITLKIPERYAERDAWPLVVTMHGAGGSHIDSWGAPYDGGFIELKVDGRGPLGSYVALSEVDVLEATDYVMRHWNVDTERAHLTGGSMGGFGTFTIGARHPDRFATATPRAGNGAHLPVENMINLPTYSIHSDDDLVVVIPAARAAIEKIERFGGMAALDETTGYGHNFNAWQEGVDRMIAWREPRSRLPLAEIDRVVFTATDAYSRGAYWARVEKFGPSGKAARVDARLDRFNGLAVSVDNVALARFDLAKMNLDRSQPLAVSVNGGDPREIDSPLPDALYLKFDDAQWRALPAAPDLPARRLHFPGGLTALYHDEPFIIVWGSLGPDSLDAQLEELAKIGSRVSRPSWTARRSHSWMPNGRIPMKRDVDVTPEDIASKNLILIGGASENALARRYAPEFSVSISSDGLEARSDDGQRWSLEARGLGLLQPNPEAPERLVYWIASGDARFYRPDSPFFDYHLQREPAPDFIVMDVERREIVAARRFDSDWRWENGYAESVIVDAIAREAGARLWSSEAVRARLGASFAIVERASDGASDAFFAPPFGFAREARVADMAAAAFESPLGILTLEGSQLRKLSKDLATAKAAPVELYPKPDDERIRDGARYRVALPNALVRDLVQAIRWAPSDYSLSDVDLRDALLTYEDAL